MNTSLGNEILNTMEVGARIMVTSLAAYITMFPRSKKKISKQIARDNYCKSVLLLWGFMQYELEKLDDGMFCRAQLTSASMLYNTLCNKKFEPLYLGAGLSKTDGKDHPKLCYEIVKWFNQNDNLAGVQAITTTGKHLFTIKALSGKLKDEHIKAFYEMGSLCEEGFEAINVMKSVLVDSKIKLNF